MLVSNFKAVSFTEWSVSNLPRSLTELLNFAGDPFLSNPLSTANTFTLQKPGYKKQVNFIAKSSVFSEYFRRCQVLDNDVTYAYILCVALNCQTLLSELVKKNKQWGPKSDILGLEKGTQQSTPKKNTF